MNRVYVYDTTLRDGAQTEGVSFSVADKLDVVTRLDQLGVDYIKGGWPGSNAKDLEFFYRLKSLPLRHSRVVAFTSTRRKGQKIEQDEPMKMVLGTDLAHCAVVGKTWDFHVEKALQTDLGENLAMIRDTVRFLKDRDIEVLFDAEHFFDGYSNNSVYALEALYTAKNAGADWLILCDTNGGALPSAIARAVADVRANGLGPVGIHAHNDGGLAIANTLFAVDAGATQVQVTVNGLGERCGNADMCSVVPNLVHKMKHVCTMGEQGLRDLKSISEHLYTLTGIKPQAHQPYVGRSAFAHKAGIHVSAVMRDPKLYEHLAPDAVGNERRVLVSELSGASNIAFYLESRGVQATPAQIQEILGQVKLAEQKGYVLEHAPETLEWIVSRALFDNKGRAALHASAECHSVEHGMECHWQWLDKEEGRHETPGVGVGRTETEALFSAAGFAAQGVVLINAITTEIIHSDQSARCRVRVEFEALGRYGCFMGVGYDSLSASVDALTQMAELFHFRQADKTAETAV